LSSLLENLIWVLLFPGWLLKRIPLRNAKEANESFVNWGQYMNELFTKKLAEARAGEQTEGMDIMGSLVRSAYGEARPTGDNKGSPGRAEKGQVRKSVMSDSDILGNAFVLIVAGHETTANSVHFALMELAMAPSSQRRLQKEIETIFGDTPAEDWDYDSSINTLLGSMVGAVLNEELRLMPPVINIPKSVRKDQDQSIVIDGKKIVLPKGAHINLNVIGVQRSPRYWPSRGTSKVDGRPDDLNDFVPERWLIKDGTVGGNAGHTDIPNDSEDDDFGGFTGRDTAAQLFRPVRGAYLPFSEGARSCLGRRLAQVEVMAVLSVIFQKYSIELAVDEWASDEEVAQMSKEEKKDLYKKAMMKARATLRGASTRITLKLHDGLGYIPVRIVKKGEERFINQVDI